MYVQPSKALAHELRAATILLKNKKLIALLNEAAERIEDLDKIAEHYRVKAEKAALLKEIGQIAHEMQEGKAE
jgi:hypothetical protein